MSEHDLLERSTPSDTNVPSRPGGADSTNNRFSSSAAKAGDELNIKTGKSHRAPLLNSHLQLNQRQEMIRIISNRLFVALFFLLALTMVGGYFTWLGHELTAGATNWMVLLCGAIGGFISLQRRLKTLLEEDLLLLARSWVYVLLSPLVGGILAMLLYFLFISGLLDGDLFPEFETAVGGVEAAVSDTKAATGLTKLFEVQGVSYTDYAKIIFWCFLAGYSESFVTNIISHFESNADRSAAS